MLTKQEILLRRGAQVESSRVREPPPEVGSTTWLAVSGFMVMELVSGLCVANHSDRILPGST